MFDESGKTLKTKIRVSFARARACRVRTPNTYGHHLRTFSHLNIFRTVAYITSRVGNAIEQTHSSVQTFRMWFLVNHVLVTDYDVKRIFQPDVFDFTRKPAVTSTAHHSQPIVLTL
jgi:hypothetical protein